MKYSHIFLSIVTLFSVLSPMVARGFEQADLERLLSTNDCVRYSLQYVNILGAFYSEEWHSVHQ